MRNYGRLQKYQAIVLFWFLVCSMVAGLGPPTMVHAATIYSYIDDQGNPVYTDMPELIPEKYRAKVKMHERPDPVRKAPSVIDSVKQTVTEQTKNLGIKMPGFQIGMEGFSPGQAKILTYAGAAAVVLLLMMYISKSQLVRMLGFCLLIVLGIGAPVLLYVSDGGPMDSVKKKATAAGQAQQDRLQQVPQ